MFSIDLHIKKSKMFLNFYNENSSEKEVVFKEIINIFKEKNELGCLLIIEGLEYKFDEIIDDIRPYSVKIKDSNKGKFIIKDLPVLYLITNKFDDMLKISKYIELFTEGKIDIVLFDRKMNDDKKLSDPKIKANNLKGKLISLSIHSDAEVFEIVSYMGNEIMEEISHIMINSIFKNRL